MAKKNNSTFEDTKFHVSEDEKNKQKIITATVGDERFPVIRLISDSELYANGLEINFNKLVSTRNLAEGLCELMNSYNITGKLNISRYQTAIKAYDFVLDKSLDYKVLETRMSIALSSDGWV